MQSHVANPATARRRSRSHLHLSRRLGLLHQRLVTLPTRFRSSASPRHRYSTPPRLPSSATYIALGRSLRIHTGPPFTARSALARRTDPDLGSPLDTPSSMPVADHDPPSSPISRPVKLAKMEDSIDISEATTALAAPSSAATSSRATPVPSYVISRRRSANIQEPPRCKGTSL